MSEREPDTTRDTSDIPCIEVLIPKAIIGNQSSLHWTLCVYSLENHPVQMSFPDSGFDVYHFMVFDWKRTLQQLLADRQVPYSVIQYFTPATVYWEGPDRVFASPDQENDHPFTSPKPDQMDKQSRTPLVAPDLLHETAD